MQARATLKNLRMSSRKVGRVAFPLRGMVVGRAEGYLAMLPHAAAHPLRKLLASAAANAVSLGAVDRSGLVITNVIVNQGAMLKRFRPRSRGMANPVRKRVSHVTFVVEGSATKRAAKKAPVQKEAAPAEVSEKVEATREREHPRATKRFEKAVSRGAKIGEFGRRVFRRKAI